MQTRLIKIYNDKSLRHIDDNGFLYVEKSPILKSGILEYYGVELLDGKDIKEIDGIKIIPDKIYRVFISQEELIKCKDTFIGKPLVNDHKWLCKDGDDAKEFQEGSLGENLFIYKDKLMAPLFFNNLNTVQEIQKGLKEELSASYTNNLIKSDNPEYDFIATDIIGNHVALVEKGRCGNDVRVFNNIINKTNKNMETKNSIELIVDGKKLDLSKFLDEELQQGEHNESIEENAATEDLETCDNEDKKKLIDEIGEVLKGKLDEELIKTVLEKLEKLICASSENTEVNNQDKSEDEQESKEENNKTNNSAILLKMANSIKEQIKTEERSRIKAYNMAKSICGDFDFSEMNEEQILSKALNSLNINVENENVSEMKAMIKAYNSSVRVDNSFKYEDISATDTVNINF